MSAVDASLISSLENWRGSSLPVICRTAMPKCRSSPADVTNGCASSILSSNVVPVRGCPTINIGPASNRQIDGVEDQIGVARYATNPDKKSCEFALVVSDKWQSKGIAHRLMRNLMEVARGRDLDVMEGQVLSNNTKMLELMASLDFEISIHPDDDSIKRVVARLHESV